MTRTIVKELVDAVAVEVIVEVDKTVDQTVDKIRMIAKKRTCQQTMSCQNLRGKKVVTILYIISPPFR